MQMSCSTSNLGRQKWTHCRPIHKEIRPLLSSLSQLTGSPQPIYIAASNILLVSSPTLANGILIYPLTPADAWVSSESPLPLSDPNPSFKSGWFNFHTPSPTISASPRPSQFEIGPQNDMPGPSTLKSLEAPCTRQVAAWFQTFALAFFFFWAALPP